MPKTVAQTIKEVDRISTTRQVYVVNILPTFFVQGKWQLRKTDRISVFSARRKKDTHLQCCWRPTISSGKKQAP